LDHQREKIIKYIPLPNNLRGTTVAVYIVLVSENGSNKSDWHFEGVSVLLEEEK
jgi:hypothetical protein